MLTDKKMREASVMVGEKEPIHNEKEMEFVIFCIENLAEKKGSSPVKVYDALTVQSDILHDYIVPCYNVLHTQSKEYILNDILDVMRERGVTV